MQSGFKEHKREEETLKKSLITLTSKINEQQNSLTAQRKISNDLKTDEEKIRRAAKEQIQTLKGYITDHTSKIEVTVQTSAQLKEDILNIQNVTTEEKLKVHHLEKCMREKLTEMKSHIIDIQREAKEGTSKVHDIMESSATQLEDINAIERSSNELRSYIADVQRLAKEDMLKVQVLEKCMADEKIDVEALQKASTTLKTDIRDIQKEAKGATTKVNGLNKSYTDQQEGLVVLQKTSTEMKTIMTEIQRVAKEECTKVQSLQKSIADLQKDLQQLQKESTDLRTGQEDQTNKSEEHMRQIQELQREAKDIELKLYKQQDQIEKKAKENKKMIKQLQDNIENVETLQKTYVNQDTFRSGVNDLEYSSKVHSRNIRQNISSLERLINRQFEDLVSGLQRVQGFHPTHVALHRADEEDDVMFSKSAHDTGQLLTSREDSKVSKAKVRRQKGTDELRYTTTPSTSDLDSVRDQSTGRFEPDVYLHSSGDEAGMMAESPDNPPAGGNHVKKQTEFGTREDEDQSS